MIYKTVTGFLLVLMLASFSQVAFGQSFGQKSTKLSSKSGHYKYPSGNKSFGSFNKSNPFNKHQQLHNKHYVSPKSFHNKYYKPHPGTKAYNQKYYGNYGYGKKHYYKNKKRYNYYGYKPYYRPRTYVYYGYDNYYPEDYYYEDVPYDGYGSTLGTVPERPSNLDVNNYVYGPEYQEGEPEYYPEEDYEYSDDYQYESEDYSYAPDPGKRFIYIWKDRSGVEHFSNDPDLIPEEYRGQVRIVEEY